MGWILLLIVVILFVLLLRKIATFKFSLCPKTLETKPIKGLKKLTDILEQSLSKSFMENVENRVRKKHRLRENEYEWRLLDLKRYFILTYLLKESPMFSEKVDDLWHEMLMFTREYDNFSEKYLGTKLHHSPNVNEEPDPDLRGFFDWVYAELFSIKRENIYLYKGFFRNPVHPNTIEAFKNLSENELINLYFKNDTNHMTTVHSLISSMKKTAYRIKNNDKKTIHGKMKRAKNHKNYNLMLVPFLSVSYYHYDEFSSYMKISSDGSSNCTSCGSAGVFSSCSADSSCSSSGGGD